MATLPAVHSSAGAFTCAALHDGALSTSARIWTTVPPNIGAARAHTKVSCIFSLCFTWLCCGAHAVANDIDALATPARWVSCARPLHPQRNLRGRGKMTVPYSSRFLKRLDFAPQELSRAVRSCTEPRCVTARACTSDFGTASLQVGGEAHAVHQLGLTEPV